MLLKKLEKNQETINKVYAYLNDMVNKRSDNLKVEKQDSGDEYRFEVKFRGYVVCFTIPLIKFYESCEGVGESDVEEKINDIIVNEHYKACTLKEVQESKNI